MKTYIILLRGVNVSGKNIILMQDLRNLLSKIGFQNVQTYIQSGNIILTSEEKKSVIPQKIKDAILANFGFETPVLIRTVDEWEKAIENNPYPIDGEKKVAFTFLNKTPKETSIEVNKAESDEFTIVDDVIYMYYSHSKMNIKSFEKKLHVNATSRNVRTTLKLLELAKKV